ncbi:unnamed protein product [Meganyctiphanes norvegica]|uniref:Uncharacterized protein n=1 Tax=Meganyctiphanes norvegica TaxID=48144 RepID=A0AAV2QD68_MEGNR
MGNSRFALMVCGVAIVGVVGALPRAQLNPAAGLPGAVPLYTPEVMQARNNFQSAFNFQSQLANLAPDDGVPPPPAPPAPIYPPGYQFGGLTPEVANARAAFFQHYVAAANAAAAQPALPGPSSTFP